MEIFVEFTEGKYAVCRLPDKERNIIRLPLRELPQGVKQFDVVILRDNGTFYLDKYAKERRMKRIKDDLKYKKYRFSFLKH